MPKLDWQTVNVDTMPQPLLKEYNAYRKQIEAANEARKSLEEKVTAHLKAKRKIPDGTEPRYAYRWGKLAIAFGDPSTTKSTGNEAFTF